MARPMFETPADVATESRIAVRLQGIHGGAWRKLPTRYCADYAVCSLVTGKVRCMVEIKWKRDRYAMAYFSASKAASLMQFEALGLPVFVCVADPDGLRWGRLPTLTAGAIAHWFGRDIPRDEEDSEPCFVIDPDRWTHYSWTEQGEPNE